MDRRAAVLGFSLGSLLLCSAAFAATPWREFGFGVDQKRYNKYETTISAANVSQLQRLWIVQTRDDYAAQSSSAIVANGLVYVGTVFQHKLLALHADTGSIHWNQKLNGPVYGSASIVGHTVYATAYGNQVYAFDSRAGTPIWTSTALTNFGTSSPTVANGKLYVGGFDGQLWAFDAATGATLWHTPTGAAIHASAAVVNGIVYIGSDKLYAIDANDGSIKWTADVGGDAAWSSPAVASGAVIIGAGDGNIYAFDAATGAKRWATPTGKYIDSSPAVANGVVYIGSQDFNVWAVRARDGQKLWLGATNGVVSSSPAVANGVVYAGSGDGSVYAFDATSGAKLWSDITPGPIRASPTVTDGRLYLSSGGGAIYAYGLP